MSFKPDEWNVAFKVGEIVNVQGSPQTMGKVVEILPAGTPRAGQYIPGSPSDPTVDKYYQVVRVHWIRKKNPVTVESGFTLQRSKLLIEYREKILNNHKARYEKATQLRYAKAL